MQAQSSTKGLQLIPEKYLTPTCYRFLVDDLTGEFYFLEVK